MSAPARRPLSVGEILDAGIKVYVRNARTLMGLTAAVVVPFQTLSALLLLSTVSSASEVPRGFHFGSTGTASASDHATSLGANAITLVIGMLVGVLTTAACVKAVSDIYLDQPTGIGASLRFALRRAVALVWLLILTTVLMGLAFVALVIPGIWLYAAWSVAVPALLIEGPRGVHALGRSFELVRGRWWSVAAVLLVAGLMTAVVGGAIEGVVVGLTLAGESSAVVAILVVSLAGTLSAVLTRPFTAAVTTVLYYDLRVRREGYDVEILAEQLGLPPAALPPGTSPDTGPESVGRPGGPPFWPPPPDWRPPTEATVADGP